MDSKLDQVMEVVQNAAFGAKRGRYITDVCDEAKPLLAAVLEQPDVIVVDGVREEKLAARVAELEAFVRFAATGPGEICPYYDSVKDCGVDDNECDKCLRDKARALLAEKEG